MYKPSPCRECPQKGCGTYHDECERYQRWKEQESERHRLINESKMYTGRGYIKAGAFRCRTHGAFKSGKRGK